MITRVSGSVQQSFGEKHGCSKGRGGGNYRPKAFSPAYKGEEPKKNLNSENGFLSSASTIFCSMCFMLGFLLMSGFSKKR